VANFINNYVDNYEQIVIIYNEFKNTITQKIKRITLVSRPVFRKRFELMVKYELAEPEVEYAKEYFWEFYFSSNLYHAMLHGAASEQASRMNAMENATKNAGEIIDGLTLKYNKARQARITMELIEIISGANAL
jgi:F-type H+-transporting ATPase subunit gamma